MSSCPECGNEIGRSRYCGCGWKAAKPDRKKVDPGLGYRRCDWAADGEQCRYPASIDERWCSEHYRCDDQWWGAVVVRASRDYHHPSIDERVAAAKLSLDTAAKAYLEAAGLAKRPNESTTNYIARLRAYNREKFGFVVKKQRAA